MYSNICMKKVEESRNFYINNPEFLYSGLAEKLGNSAEEYMENIHNDSISNDNFLLVYLRLLKDNKNRLTDNSIRIIDKLINDVNIREKIRLINDGSFLNNRIWIKILSDSRKLDIEVNFYAYQIEGASEDKTRFDKELSLEEKIDFLYNNFDTIYFQIKPVDWTRQVLKYDTIGTPQKPLYYTHSRIYQ